MAGAWVGLARQRTEEEGEKRECRKKRPEGTESRYCGDEFFANKHLPSKMPFFFASRAARASFSCLE
jgi:hypothetical protein